MSDLSQQEQTLLQYLRGALPVADQLSLGEDELLPVVRHALRVRAEAPWGKALPEELFLAYVLFPRVNNEDLVFYQGPIYDALKPRLAGLGMRQAALEVNYWCCENATYQSTDVRTANPLTVIRRAYGRCGEESVLLVSALRSVGIPARIVYVPRWAHCDDNHAWVEAWLDGDWHYMGACEPEPVVDSGWFTAAASKAMLIHTRAYGLESQAERVETHIGGAAIINRTAAYAQTRLFTVRVLEGGQPCAGLTVRFELANEAELYPINEQTTNAKGEASLLTGLGTLWLHITDGARYLCRMVDVSREGEVELAFEDAVAFDSEPRAFHQRPPLETRIQPALFSAEVAARHAERLRACEAARAAYEATFATEDEYLRGARGNHAVIRDFLEQAPFEPEDKRALLGTLRQKDLVDVGLDTLRDALETALPAKADDPREVWLQSVLCPRVYNECLEPVRRALRAATGPYADARAVWADIERRVALCDMQPITVFPRLLAMLEAGRGGALPRDILYVAIARAHGLAARLNPATLEKEYYADGRYQAICPSRQEDATLLLENRAGRALRYAQHFTIGVLQNGAYQTLRLEGFTLDRTLALPVFAGRYRIVTCIRQIDGSIDGLTFPVEVLPGGKARVELTLYGERTEELITRAPLMPLKAWEGAREAALPGDTAGQAAIYALIAPGQEPTEHFLNELLEAKQPLREKGVAVRLLVEQGASVENEKLQRTLTELSGAKLLTQPEPSVVMEWRRQLRAGDLRLPFALAVNADGEALFAFTNYCVGSVQSLLQILGL